MGNSSTFNGITDKIVVATGSSPLDNPWATGGTVTMWIYPTDAGANATEFFFTKYNLVLNDSWGIFMGTGGGNSRLWFRAGFTTTEGAWRSTSSTPLTLNGWNHLAFTYDASSVTNDPLCYVAGVAESMDDFTTPVGVTNVDSSIPVIIADESTATDYNYTGQMAWLTVYDRVLSLAEINQVMLAPNSITTNLLAGWSLTDDPVTASDWTGHGLNGLSAGTPTASTNQPPITIKRGASALFNGSTSHIEYNDDTSMDGATEISLCCWVNFDDFDLGYGMAGKWDGAIADRGYALLINFGGATSRLELLMDFASGFSAVSSPNLAPIDFTVGDWAWVVSTFDCGGGTNSGNLYVNGVDLSATLRVDGSVTSISNTTATFNIGSLINLADKELPGKMAHIHCYDKVLSIDEVNELMYKPSSIAQNLIYYIAGDNANYVDEQQRLTAPTITDTVASSDGPPVSFPQQLKG